MSASILPYINKRILVLPQDTPAYQVARALHENCVGSALISDRHGHIVGFVTDRDISSLILGFGLPNDTAISEIMATEIISVDKEASLSVVVGLMKTNGVRRIPILEKHNQGREKCIGMVTLDDLISTRSISLEDLGAIVRSQVKSRNFHFHNPVRSENRREQTLSRFNKIMAEKMNVPKEVGESIAFYILKQLAKRLPFSVSANLISQLPRLLQEDLLDLTAGPDERITAENLIGNMTIRFKYNRSDASNLARYFWLGLEEFLDHGILKQILSHLPHDMRILFDGDDGTQEESRRMEYEIS